MWSLVNVDRSILMTMILHMLNPAERSFINQPSWSLGGRPVAWSWGLWSSTWWTPLKGLSLTNPADHLWMSSCPVLVMILQVLNPAEGPPLMPSWSLVDVQLPDFGDNDLPRVKPLLETLVLHLHPGCCELGRLLPPAKPMMCIRWWWWVDA